MIRPVMTAELARRFEKVWAKFQAARIAGIMNREGNPLGIGISHFGEAVALRAQQAAQFNRVIGLTEANTEHVDAILNFYREVNLRPYLELTPGLTGDQLPRRLHQQGAYHAGFNAVTWATPARETKPPAPGVEVRPVAAGELDVFLSVFLEGFTAPTASAANMQFWLNPPGWHLYLATVEDTPAGAAVLYIDDGIGYLAAASTIPAMRGRGCQTALLNRRIAEAARHDCELITAQCQFGSDSHRNMQRVGLEMAYNKAMWTVAS